MSAIHRIVPRVVASVALVLSVGALCGCVGEKPEVEPSVSASAVPVFATEEDALAAATTSFIAYQSAVDQAFTTGDVTGIAQRAVDPALTRASEDVASFRADQQSQTGQVTVTNVSLVDAPAALFPAGNTTQVYACLDVSQVDVRDANGVSIVPADRPLKYPVIADLEWSAPEEVFLVSEQEVWNGANFCL